MSKLLLGALVVAMLALTGVVGYNTFVAPDAVAPAAAVNTCCESPCCGDATPVVTGCPLCTEAKASTCCQEATATKTPACCEEGAAATPATGAKKN